MTRGDSDVNEDNEDNEVIEQRLSKSDHRPQLLSKAGVPAAQPSSAAPRMTRTGYIIVFPAYETVTH